MKSQLVLFCFITFAIAIILATSPVAGGGGHGEWKPIKDLKGEHVKKIAEFAVKEHDNEEKEHLKLDEVVKGYKKARRHKTKYKLVLAAKDEKKKKKKTTEEEQRKDSKHYVAVVVDKSEDDKHRLHLISFKPVKK